MTWTHEKPTKPGLYWYRRDEHSNPGDYEALTIGADDQQHEFSSSWDEHESAIIDPCSGEWYGPVRPPLHDAGEWESAESKPNVRIIVRLRHGGSFYVENAIPNEVACTLSTKLKSLREHGESIPAHLRVKMSGMVHELLAFARTSSKSDA
jgi:hypothetical protein